MPRRPPAISVIVAIYNQAACLPDLLASLDEQDCDAELEIIICDDGSDDDPLRCIRSSGVMSRRDVKYIWQPDEGFRLSRSRNNGIRCAQGDVLVLIDGNSVVKPFFLADHLAAHHGQRRLVYGGRLLVDAVNAVNAVPAAGVDRRRLLSDDAHGQDDLEKRRSWLATPRPWMACIGANLSVARSQAILFDEAFEGWGSEDRDFAYRLWARGLSVHVLERTGLVQPLHDDLERWSPLAGGHQAIVAAVKSKLHLYRKHGGDIMAPSLDMVRCCHFDTATRQWRLGESRDEDATAILEEFEQWLAHTSKSP
jgi:validoxylamine A glucosyltransferase